MFLHRAVPSLVTLILSFTFSMGLCAEPGTGAGKPDFVSPGTRDLSIDVAGDARTFHLHIPPRKSKEPPAPLVIVLHGLGGSGEHIARITGFSRLADRKGFVAVYPDGIRRMWRVRDPEDPAFITALMDALIGAGTVDARRIYVTGFSNGGLFSNTLAATLSDRIAAAAPVSGTLLQPAPAHHGKSARRVPICYWHGTDDNTVGYDGVVRVGRREATALGVEELLRWWVQENGCATEPKVEPLADQAPDDGTTVERRVYDGPAPVVFYRIVGGGHTWPGAAAALESRAGRSTQDVSATEIIWEFFSGCTLPEPKAPR